MTRRQMGIWAGLLGLTTLVAVPVATHAGAKSKTGCVCCGSACTCPSCSCDSQKQAGAATEECACCGPVCCTAKVSHSARPETKADCCAKEVAKPAPVVATAPVVRKACACCGEACTCASCACDGNSKDSKTTGTAGDCCGCGACDAEGKAQVKVASASR